MNPIGRFQLEPKRIKEVDIKQTVGTVYEKSSCSQFEWEIDDFNSLKNERIFSEYFQFDNASWRMELSWDKISNWSTKNISITLQRKSYPTDGVDATIGFKRTDGSIFDAVHNVLEMPAQPCPIVNQSRIYSFPFSEWKDIELPNGSLTVVCILNFAETPVSDTTCPQISYSILIKDFEDLFLSERDADVTIRVKGKQFKAHRSILVARSTVFATMFQHDMAERTKGEVDIDDCDPDSFRDFMVYLYTGKTDRVTSDNARGLYITADKYLVEELKDKCSKCLSVTLSIDSTCDVLVLATMHSDSNLLKSATDFFVKNAKKIMQTQKWLEFQSKNCKLVHELFFKAADYIKV